MTNLEIFKNQASDIINDINGTITFIFENLVAGNDFINYLKSLEINFTQDKNEAELGFAEELIIRITDKRFSL